MKINFISYLLGYLLLAFIVTLIVLPITLAIAITPYWMLLSIATYPTAYIIFVEQFVY